MWGKVGGDGRSSNFDVYSDHLHIQIQFWTISTAVLGRVLPAVCGMLYAMRYRVLITACILMVCPIYAFRQLEAGRGAGVRPGPVRRQCGA